MSQSVTEKLIGVLGHKERASIKSQAWGSIGNRKREKYDNFDVEIVSTSFENGNAVILARVWDKKGNQVGFGRNGDVDIERFVFINPPILILGSDGKTMVEDVLGAVRISLEHTISVCDKVVGSKKIKVGKIGHTVSTFYPSLDGRVERNVTGESWASIRGGEGNFADTTGTSHGLFLIQTSETSNQFSVNRRTIFIFDTSSIPDTDVLNSGVLSFYGTAKGDDDGNLPTMGIVSAAPASDVALVAGDYVGFGGVEFSTRKTYAVWSTTGFNDFTLDRNGLNNVSKTNTTKFGVKEGKYDIDGGTPSWSDGNRSSYMSAYMVDYIGTAYDPKLVISHDASYQVDLSEGVSLSETIGKISSYNKTHSDISVATDTKNIPVSYGKTQSETVTGTENKTFSVGYVRTKNESEIVTDSLERTVGKSVTFDDVSNEDDTIASNVSYARESSETVTGTDTHTRTNNIIRIIAESVVMSDTFIRTVTHYFTVVTDFVIDGVLDVISDFSLMLTEFVNGTDSYERNTSQTRTFQSDPTITDDGVEEVGYSLTPGPEYRRPRGKFPDS